MQSSGDICDGSVIVYSVVLLRILSCVVIYLNIL